MTELCTLNWVMSENDTPTSSDGIENDTPTSSDGIENDTPTSSDGIAHSECDSESVYL